jgi:hypothetical protein
MYFLNIFSCCPRICEGHGASCTNNQTNQNCQISTAYCLLSQVATLISSDIFPPYFTFLFKTRHFSIHNTCVSCRSHMCSTWWHIYTSCLLLLFHHTRSQNKAECLILLSENYQLSFFLRISLTDTHVVFLNKIDH